jgi:hypothetical protein
MATALIASAINDVAIANMIALTFFFLLCPGEYTGTKSKITPFWLCNIKFFTVRLHLNHLTADYATLHSATFATLTFTGQKNGVHGKVIGLVQSSNIQLYPLLPNE